MPNLWSVDGEVTVTEQKPGEVAEELASSYERKLIEVRPAPARVGLLPGSAALGTLQEQVQPVPQMLAIESDTSPLAPPTRQNTTR